MRGSLAVVLAFAGAPTLATAQSFALDLPLKSQRAEVSQTIGLTEMRIVYHRPLVNGRVIWDSLVPYGTVWRTGANMNTTISFTDPVMIDDHLLEKGTYGLHMIPTADTWTVIFSRNATSWGSFTYDQREDALRLTVTPRAAPMHEALTYQFDDIQPSSTTVELLWDKLVVPFRVSVNVPAVVQASLRQQLRAFARYNWMGWNDAASYLLAEKIALDTALAYADTSIANEDRFDNEMTKSDILLALGRQSDATVAESKALNLGTAEQVDQFARTLLAGKRTTDALGVFRQNAARHPDRWFVHDGLAHVYSAESRFGDASREMRLAVAAAPAGEKSRLDTLLTHLAAKQDINK